MESLKEELYNCFLKADKFAGIKLVENWALENSYEEALTKILEPTLAKLGEGWASRDDVNLAQGYISAKITEEIMKRVIIEREKLSIVVKRKGIAVMGNIEDDYHSLGRKMVVNFLVSAGWEVYDLGNDVLAEEFVDKAIEVNASIIGASAMMYTNAKNMRKLKAELEKRDLDGKIKFVVGGAIFNLRPELVEWINADGTATNAIQAIELFNNLTQKDEK